MAATSFFGGAFFGGDFFFLPPTAGANWKLLKPKSKQRVIRYSDFTSQEAYAAALAEAAIPLARVSDSGETTSTEIDDDDAIIQALFVILQ